MKELTVKLRAMQSKIRKEDILTIKSGESKTFLMADHKACLSARVYACQLCRSYPRADVERYKCSINKADNLITITAIKKEAYETSA